MHWYEWKIWDRFYVLQYFLQLLPLDVLTLPAHLSPQTLLWHAWELVCISALFSRGTEMLSIPARQWGKYIQILEQREFRDWNFFWRSSVGFFSVSRWQTVWPDACRSNLFEGRWTCGRTRLKRGALFWLRHTPFPFTTIQLLSCSKPSGPTGQSWTCMKNSTGSNQDRKRQK